MTTPDWPTLRHAYGPATDIPALLRRARHAPAPADHRSEPWFTLWSALYHQDDIYSASYAAVPELVRLAEDCEPAVAVEALFLAASIELRRGAPRAPAIPHELHAAYDEAITNADRRATSLRRAVRDPHGKLRVASAVFEGDVARARELLGETDEGMG